MSVLVGLKHSLSMPPVPSTSGTENETENISDGLLKPLGIWTAGYGLVAVSTLFSRLIILPLTLGFFAMNSMPELVPFRVPSQSIPSLSTPPTTSFRDDEEKR
eukprot:TRINITY_DN7476_c0_g1_i1.p1 TRINITY_DN7476_c0_g1~~TRINITY_DN7476_c0_g1_i1.p1  ORF type:complete len:103 (+),score=25.73 TRINITY_DN7476_c0_g1_i1:339-647(+)